MGSPIRDKVADFIKSPRIPSFLIARYKRVRWELREWLMALVTALPGQTGSLIRKAVIPFGTVGKNVLIRQGFWVKNPGKLSIGDNTRISYKCHISAAGSVEIGRNVLIGPDAIIYSENHNYRDSMVCIKDQGYTKAKVVIEDDVWLCARVTILPGVRVRQGTVVAAGAVVTKDTDPLSVVAGVPAIKIGQRLNPETNRLTVPT